MKTFPLFTLLLAVGLLFGCSKRKLDAENSSDQKTVRFIPPVQVQGKKKENLQNSPIFTPSEEKELANPDPSSRRGEVRSISSK